MHFLVRVERCAGRCGGMSIGLRFVAFVSQIRRSDASLRLDRIAMDPQPEYVSVGDGRRERASIAARGATGENGSKGLRPRLQSVPVSAIGSHR